MTKNLDNPVADRRVLSLTSRGSLELPVSDLIVDGKFDVYPHVEAKGLLFLQFRRSMLTLSAGTFVGLIPLTPNVTVQVEPRLPVGNLARVLDVAQGVLGTIPRTDRLYKSDEVVSDSVLDFIAFNLLDALKPLQENGLFKDYVLASDVTSNPRGRIDLNSTMSQAWVRGQYHRVVTRQFKQTPNLAVNRVLKAALKTLLTKPRTPSDHRQPLLAAINKSYVELPSTIGNMTLKDYEEAKHIISAGLLPESRLYYRRALEISLAIISRRGIWLQGSGNDMVLASFIINFEDLFEDYLRGLLSLKANSTPLHIRKGKKPLFDDRKNPSAEPDIVISSSQTGKTVVAEVKYKDKLDREDYNQVITYAVTYRTERAILVHQNKPGAPSGPRHIGTMNGIVLDAYAFDLSHQILDAEEQAFADCLFAAVS